MKTLIRTITIAGTVLLLSACQIPTHRSADPAPADPEGETRATDSRPAMTFPRTDVVIACPEPDPVEPPACPPPPPEPSCPPCAGQEIDGKMIVGGVEKVAVTPPGLTFTARIDSGAAGTSIHATNIVRFERDGEPWVRFDVDNPDGEPVSLERPVVRRVRIRQAELDEAESRVVVMLDLAMGSLAQQVEISLTDRSEMEYPVLIGRNVLRNNAVVDVSQEFIAR